MDLSKHFQDALKDGLHQITPDLKSIRPEDLQILSSAGLSHDHIRIGNSGWLLRIPRGNQLGMNATDYLDLQESCFSMTARSGHAPSIKGILPPSEILPHGALIVEEIKGHKATSPKDAKAIAQAFAAIHKIRPDNSKLQIAEKPFASQHFLLTQIFGNAPENAPISSASQTLLKDEQSKIATALEAVASNQYPLTLIGGDSHPANFIITPAGKAYLVDVEFAMFDAPYIDLADASLAITERLEPDVTIWSDKARHEFYQTWQNHADADLTQHLSSGRAIAERAVRLRTLLWLADWAAGTQSKIETTINARTKGNWDRMAATYLAPQTLKRVLQGDQGPHLPPFPQTPAPAGAIPKP